MNEKLEYATGAERRKVKLCPCGESNKNLKFANFKGNEQYGYCHSCDKTFFPPTEENEYQKNVSVSSIYKVPGNQKPETLQPLPITIIPDDLVKENIISADNASLIKWLSDEKRRGNNEMPFTLEQVQTIVSQYRIKGTIKYQGGIAFIYIDINDKFRQIKLMAYSPTTGKRIKEPGKIMQIGKDLSQQAGIENINIVSCFFGEHLLKDNNKDVYIFESEATAIYASIFYPDYVCLATGGKNGCKWDKYEQYKVLIGRRIMLWPDIDAQDEWTAKALTLSKEGLNIYVSTLIIQTAMNQAARRGIAFDEFRKQKYDLRDILIYKNPNKKSKNEEVIITPPPISQPDPPQKNLELQSPDNLMEEGSVESIPTLKKFSTTEYKEWIESIEIPKIPIRLNAELTVFDLIRFVAGRLNHIDAFTHYREQGNRSLFIHQLQQIRKQLAP